MGAKKRNSRQKSPTKTKTSRRQKMPLAFKLLLFVVIIFIFTITGIKVSEYIIENNHHFPKIEISLSGVSPEQIALGDTSAEYFNNQVSFNNFSYDNVKIEGRGNLSWNMPKKPYQLKFSEKISPFNLPGAKKWVLLADYLDETHLRNNLAFYLENIFNFEKPLHGTYAEVYIDNIYYGLYYLTEKIEINKNRINLKDSLGLIVELDNLHNIDETCPYFTKSGNCLDLHDIVNPDNSDDSIDLFIKKFDTLEIAIENQDYETIKTLIDVDSFARYFLLSEFSNNPDAYGTSFYMYLDGEEDKIHAASGWDFDLAFGNQGFSFLDIEPDLYLSPENTMFLKDYIKNDYPLKTSSDNNLDRLADFIYSLLDVPEFEARVKEIYRETLSGHGEELLNYINSQADYIKDAASRDKARWKLSGDFDEEVAYLLDWVERRYNHFEEVYGLNSLDQAPESPQLSEE